MRWLQLGFSSKVMLGVAQLMLPSASWRSGRQPLCDTRAASIRGSSCQHGSRYQYKGGKQVNVMGLSDG